MGSCNTTQNEAGGKDLLLKICSEIEVSTSDSTTDDPTELITDTAHGLAVGDLIRWTSTNLGTINDVSAELFYFVVEIVSTTKFTVAATPGGTPIEFEFGIDDLEAEVFKSIGGLRSNGFSFASDAIERTNRGSNQWRELVDNAGIRSVSISGSGVYTHEANWKAMRNSAFKGELVCLAFIEAVLGEIYSGCFKITAIEGAGEYDGESSFSMSAESSGRINVSEPTDDDVVGDAP